MTSTQKNVARWAGIALFLVFVLFPAVADGESPPDPALLGTWRWLGAETPVEEIIPGDPDAYILEFGKDGRLTARLEANIASTTYTAVGSTLTVQTPMAVTMAAWLPDSPAPTFLSLLEYARVYFFRDGFLYIDTFADGGTLQFEKMK